METHTPRSVWRGPTIRLRAIEPEDWETYDAWNQDDGQARGLDSVPFPQSRAATRRWADEESQRRPEHDHFRFVVENRAAVAVAVGDLTTHDCDRRAGAFSYGLNILPAHRRRGYASEAILLVLRYFFRELRYQKATVGVFAFNTPSIHLHERLGFQRDGRLRRMTYGRGRFDDLLMFGLTADEFIPLAVARGFPLDFGDPEHAGPDGR